MANIYKSTFISYYHSLSHIENKENDDYGLCTLCSRNINKDSKKSCCMKYPIKTICDHYFHAGCLCHDFYYFCPICKTNLKEIYPE